jgi:glycosyltransferase involved in cell wall biosynthesis
MTIRILFVQHHAGIGGATRSLLSIIEQLDRTRYQPIVLFTAGSGLAADILRHAGIPVIVRNDIIAYGHGNGARPSFNRFPPWLPITQLLQIWPSARRFSKLLREHTFDLVYLNSSILMPALLGCHLAGIRPIVHVREILYWGALGLRFRLVRYLLQTYAAHLIVLSETSRAQFTKTSRVPITVIYNAVDFAVFNRNIDAVEARRRLGITPEQQVVLMLGGGLAHKGAHVLVRAIAQVRFQHQRIKAVILGFNPDEYSSTWRGRIKKRLAKGQSDRLLELIDKLGVRDCVQVEGSRHDIPDWLAVAEICVFPATTDHFPRPVIEAAAMAVPAIASDGPTSRELITDGVNGRLVPANQPLALATAINKLLAVPQHRLEMGERAYEQALLRFQLQDQWQRIKSVIESVVNSR